MAKARNDTCGSNPRYVYTEALRGKPLDLRKCAFAIVGIDAAERLAEQQSDRTA
jgi:hypothetical protein